MKKALSPRKALNVIFAFALVASMVPAQAFATSNETASHAELAQEDRYSEVKALTSDSEGADAAQVQEGSQAAASGDAASADNTEATAGATVPAAANSANASGTGTNGSAAAAPQITRAEAQLADAADEAGIEMVRTAVAMSSTATTVKTIGGLTYALAPATDASPATAALVGFGDAPEGELSIPAKITVGTVEYTVTNICSMGGGVRASKQ